MPCAKLLTGCSVGKVVNSFELSASDLIFHKYDIYPYLKFVCIDSTILSVP